MKFTIKGSKKFQTHDGYAWSATLYIDGVKAAYAWDEGRGGEIRVDWFNKELEAKFGEYVNSLPLDMSSPDVWPQGRKIDVAGAIAALVDEHDNKASAAKRFKRLCKTMTLIRIKGEPPEVFYQYRVQFSPIVKAKILASPQNAGKDIIFINEEIAA